MDGPVRLVEVLGALSLACDAADGFPHETTVRTAVLAAGLARSVGDDALVTDTVIGALLRHIGCTGFAVEEARRYGAGDDVALREVMAEVDFGQPEKAVGLIRSRLAAAAPPDARDAAVDALLGDAAEAGAAHDAAQCDAAERLGALLPVPPRSLDATGDAFERWDGAGGPRRKAGTELSLVARIVEVAYVAELLRGRQGRGGAAAELRARSGHQLDPALVDTFLADAARRFDAIDDPSVPAWDRLLDSEPVPYVRISAAQLDDVALAFARFADLKSPYFAGHSEEVARTADAAAASLGLSTAERRTLTRAALLHDIGIVAVPTGIWEAPRPLSRYERDRVRFHAWETHRILGATPLFGAEAQIAGLAHERLDGSGYHRAIDGAGLSAAARVLAAADVWVALRSHRPHRAALTDEAARRELVQMVHDRLIDRGAADAVLAVAAAAPTPRGTWPAGLTDREVQVLREVAAGHTNREIAAALHLSERTVAHHVEHVYDKIGIRSRAGATLYALEQRLLS